MFQSLNYAMLKLMRYYFKYKLAFSLLEELIILMVIVNYSGALVKQSKLQKLSEN